MPFERAKTVNLRKSYDESKSTNRAHRCLSWQIGLLQRHSTWQQKVLVLGLGFSLYAWAPQPKPKPKPKHFELGLTRAQVIRSSSFDLHSTRLDEIYRSISITWAFCSSP